MQNNRKSAQAAATTAPPARTSAASAVDEESAAPPWRVIAIARRQCTVYLDGGLTKVIGGDILDHPPHVGHVEGDENFELVPMASPEELDALRRERAEQLAQLRIEAAKLGCVVYRDGEVPAPRNRR